MLTRNEVRVINSVAFIDGGGGTVAELRILDVTDGDNVYGIPVVELKLQKPSAGVMVTATNGETTTHDDIFVEGVLKVFPFV